MSAQAPSTSDPDGTPARAPAGWASFWILTAALGALLFVRDAMHSGAGLSIGGDALWGRDFVNVYTSGMLTLQGRLDLLYEVGAYQAFQAEMFAGGLRHHLFSYPPATLLYAWLFALLPYPAAWLAWLTGTGGLFVLAARPYLRDAGLPAWLAVLAPASIVNIWAGHYGFLIGALWLFAWTNLARRPVLAGILVGLMLMKPHLAILMPLVLAWRRQWIAFAAAGLTVLALIALSAVLFGPDLWFTYVTKTAVMHAAMVDDVGTFFLLLMPTLTPALAILGVPVWAATILQGVAALGAVFVLLRYMPGDDRRGALATATATFIVLPYGFAYDMTVAGLAGLVLLRNPAGTAAARLAIAAAALVPLAVMYLNMAQVPVAPLLVAFQLLALLGLAGGRPARPTEAHANPPGITRPPG